MTATEQTVGRLGRASLIYGLGTLVSRAASIIMLPVYTRLLTPADYGILQMLDITLDVIAIMLSAGATAGVMRFYYKRERDDERRELLGSAFLMLLGLNAVGSLAMIVATPLILSELLGPTATPTMVLLAALNFTVGSLSVVPMLLLQMQERATLFTMLNVARLLVQLTLNIVLLVVFRMGPTGILISNLTASVIIGTLTTVLFFREVGFRLSWSAIRDLRRFAVPYQITTAGAFILTFGNRFFIRRYVGLDEVGIYGLAFQFGFLLASLTSAPILRAWTPQRHEQARLPRDERDRLFNRDLLFFSSLTIIGAAAIALFVEPVLGVMSAPAFHGASVVVPLIVLAFVLQAWSDTFMFNFDVSERPSCITIGTWLTVALSLGLYVTMIPRWGVAGAALSTVIAFATRLAIYWIWSRRVWPVTVEWSAHVRLLAAAAGAYLLYLLLGPSTLFAQFAVAFGAFTAFTLVSWFSTPRSRRDEVTSAIAPRWLRLRARFAP